MNRQSNRYPVLIIASIIAFTGYLLTGPLNDSSASAQVAVPVSGPDYGVDVASGPSDEITEEERTQIKESIRRNIDLLVQQGKLSIPVAGSSPVTLGWPVGRASGLREFAIGGVRNFVDQNPAFPDQVLDWNCGSRTYDTAAGYNHRGTDIASYPYPWKRMDNNEAYAVAAAAGVIVSRFDGNYDRNCTPNNSHANAVYIMHADGSIAWYLHLKTGAITRKGIGDTVAAGEYLGVIGSSGSSTIPHVHLEVYNAAGQLQDPYQGACNTLNNFSWWAEQEPYRNSKILTLYTGSAAPVFPTCPQREIMNEKIVFQPLDTFFAISAYRDQLVGQQTEYSILRPDGSVFVGWTLTSPQNYVARYWWSPWQLPAEAPLGEWRFRAVYNGVTHERTFYVGQPPNVSVSGRVTTLTGTPIPNATVVIGLDQPLPNTAYLSKVLTDQFGNYQFDDVVVGRGYRVYVVADNYEFLMRTITIARGVGDLDFFSLNEN